MTDRTHPKFGTHWDDADDSVLIEHYAAKGACWCAGQMPWRTPAAIRSRAHAIKCGPTSAERAVLMREHKESGKPREWAPPGPRYPSVWAFASGQTA